MYAEIFCACVSTIGNAVKEPPPYSLLKWVEPKLLTIYTVGKNGKKIKNGVIPIINDRTYEDYQGFLKILEMYLVSLGMKQLYRSWFDLAQPCIFTPF